MDKSLLYVSVDRHSKHRRSDIPVKFRRLHQMSRLTPNDPIVCKLRFCVRPITFSTYHPFALNDNLF
jgi:hypothetical protein